jgi:hypothetical protein
MRFSFPFLLIQNSFSPAFMKITELKGVLLVDERYPSLVFPDSYSNSMCRVLDVLALLHGAFSRLSREGGED